MNSSEKKNSTSAIKWIAKCASPHFLYLAVLTLVSVAVSVMAVYFALCSKNVIDAATNPNLRGRLFYEMLRLVALLAANIALDSFASFLHIRVLSKFKIDLKKNLFSSILRKDYLSISKYHTGDLLNRINNDASVVASSVTTVVPGAISLVSRLVLSLYVLFVLDKFLALMCIILGPVIVVAARLYKKKFKALHKLYQESDGKTSSFMQDSLLNVLVIKSFGNENKILSYLKKLQDKNFRIALKRNNISIAANILFYLIVTAGYYFALGYGAYKISAGVMTFGTLTALLQLVGDSIAPFRTVSSLLPQYYQALASAERIMEILDIDDEFLLSDGAKTDVQIKKIYADMQEICFENVCFSYDGKKKILENLNLNIKKNEFVAISGRSGIGKSTFLKLMLGIISPTDGEIYIKCRNGKIPFDKTMRKMFSYVPQGNMLVSGTICDNIAFSENEICEEKIIECAKNAQIYKEISKLENGFDTMLGEGGAGLSEGQIQRLAVARAIYHNADILLLDEATSALDKDTELSLLKSLRAMNNKTLIIVTHRKEVMDFCDRIISVK